MKKSIILVFAAMLCICQTAFAVPAKKGKFTKLQPDGSTIVLERHGDEFYHWTTDEDGRVVERDNNGIYRLASMPDKEFCGGRAAANLEAARIRSKRAALSQGITKAPSVVSTYHFPVVLVQFSDVRFMEADPYQSFYNLLNQEGYSENGATGSVHDYYWENSLNTFNAQFDVFGPYTFNGACANYADDSDAARILWAAIRNYDSTVDWSKYDNDGDGVVDMVFLYYAGYNQAEGNDDTIWPHKWTFSSAGTTTSSLDGVSFSIYACTSELKGYASGNPEMCGIGTCAHEFSHTQGLPDFYDTNYSKFGGDTACGATYSYDIMADGSYNNDGRTPPYFNAEERVMMGWLDAIATIPGSGNITIPSVDKNFAYKLPTNNTAGGGEYFIFECRSGQGWDSYVTPGLIVYHVDKSTTYRIKAYTANNSYRTYTAYQTWTTYTSYINVDGTHPCFYIVPAADQSNLYFGNDNKLAFPAGATFYTPKDWAGNDYDLFSEISFYSNGTYEGTTCPVVTLHRGDNYKGVSGQVTNTSGVPISGATVNIYASAPSQVIGGGDTIEKISGRILGNLRENTTTDENGCYTLDLSGESGSTLDIEVVAHGYIVKYETITVSDELQKKNFILRGINEPIDYTLKKYDFSAGIISSLGYGDTTLASISAAVGFTASELTDYVGRKILRLSFAYTLEDNSTVDRVYALIDAGGSRVLSGQISGTQANQWNTVDISGANLYIEAGKDYYFGYALYDCTDPYPLLFSTNNPKDLGFTYYGGYSSSYMGWTPISSGNLLIDVELDNSSAIDYNYIDNPGYGSYSVGDSLALRLIEAEGNRKPGTAIQWYFDDEPVNGSSVSFKYSGTHLIEARFTTTEGKTKIVELEINVGL